MEKSIFARRITSWNKLKQLIFKPPKCSNLPVSMKSAQVETSWDKLSCKLRQKHTILWTQGYLSKQHDNIKSTLTSAIQILNIDQLPDLLKYGKEYNFTKFAPVLVMWPEALNIGIAPKEIKQKVIKKCEPYIEIYPQIKSFINIIKKSSSTLTWEDTKKFLTYYDHVRNYSAKDMCPIYDKIEHTLQGA